MLPRANRPQGVQLPEWSLGLTLLAGFWAMLLLDTLSHWLPSAAASAAGGVGAGSIVKQRSGTHAPDDASDGVSNEHVILLAGMHGQPGTPPRAASSSAASGGPAAGSAAVPDASRGGSASARLSTASGGSSSRKQLQQQAALQQEGPGASMRSAGSSSGLARPLPGRLSVAAGGAAGGSSAGGGGSLLGRLLSDPSQQALLGLIVHAGAWLLLVVAVARRRCLVAHAISHGHHVCVCTDVLRHPAVLLLLLQRLTAWQLVRPVCRASRPSASPWRPQWWCTRARWQLGLQPTCVLHAGRLPVYTQVSGSDACWQWAALASPLLISCGDRTPCTMQACWRSVRPPQQPRC